MSGVFLCASCQLLLPGRFQANVQHCTWLGSPVCAACGGFSTWGNTWESRTLPDSDTRNPAHIRRGAPTIHEKSRPFYTADGFLHIRVILKRDTEHARREAGISRPSCAGSRAARSGRRRRPPAASTARAGFHRRSGAARTQTARRNRKSRCRPLHP